MTTKKETRTRSISILLLAGLILSALQFIGCGTGQAKGNLFINAPADFTTMTFKGAVVAGQVNILGTVLLSATIVDAAPGATIAWVLDCGSGADCGSFSKSTTSSCNEVFGPCTGVYQTVYTGPATIPSGSELCGTGFIYLLASESGKSGDFDGVCVTINQVAAISFSATPATLATGGSTPITATTTGVDETTTILWELDCGSSSACGTLLFNEGTSGKANAYYAPSVVPSGNPVRISACIVSSDVDVNACASATIEITANTLTTTTTTLVSSMNPSTFGQAVTFTASVTPSGPTTLTGTVSFTSNGAAISAACSGASLTSGLATCPAATLPVGTDTIEATYSGDANYLASTSAAFSQVVSTGSTTPIITTFAGCCETDGGFGTQGYAGDGGPATAADLAGPTGVAAMDGAGNLYIADNYNGVIRSVNAAGIISTVAGGASSVCGSATNSIGDGCPATSAELSSPFDVAVDSVGYLYIADANNNRIRKVTKATGIITTVAGDGNFTVCSGATNGIGDGCPATSASLYEPEGVAVDSAGNLYIADYDDCVIRKVTASTGIISTVAGTATGAGTHANCGYSGDGGLASSAELNTVQRVVLDSAGNLYIADPENQVIRVVNTRSSAITVAGVSIGPGDIRTVAGTPGVSGFSGDGGPATGAQMFMPEAVALDVAGNLYICDTFNSIVREVNAASGIITAAAGSGESSYYGDGGPATSAELISPQAVALDTVGNFYITDQPANVIRKVTVATPSAKERSALPKPEIYAQPRREF